jgi:hypothetical protein
MIHLTLEDLEALVEARIAESSAEKLATTNAQQPLEPSPPTLPAKTYSYIKQTPTAFTNKPFSNSHPVPPSPAPIDRASPPTTVTYSPPKAATFIPTTTPPVPFTRPYFSALPPNKLTACFREDPAQTPVETINHLVIAPRTAHVSAQQPDCKKIKHEMIAPPTLYP